MTMESIAHSGNAHLTPSPVKGRRSHRIDGVQRYGVPAVSGAGSAVPMMGRCYSQRCFMQRSEVQTKGPMTAEMLQGAFAECNMGGIELREQQNPTGGRRLGHRGAVSGRLWIFATMTLVFPTIMFRLR